jgi:hypothetical protein
MRFEAGARREPGLLRRGRGMLSRWVRPALDARAPTGVLTGAQLRALRALTEVVAGAPIADADWPPIRAALILAARERPGFGALCARACRTLARLRPGGFADASLAERGVRRGAPAAVRPVPAPALPNCPRGHHGSRTPVPELIRAYFDAPVGWAVVGYDAVLGECRDPFAYTRKPA